jgi:DNA-binding GntR family transcriptional regulator
MASAEEMIQNKPINLNDWVYSIIKERILNNTYPPETQLKVAELSDELNVSRTPVREALIRLKIDGLVHVENRVGFFVSGISLKEFREISELRSLIECYAAEKASMNLDDSQLGALKKAQADSKAAIEKKAFDEYNQCEMKIHSTILDALDNDKMKQVMDDLQNMIYRQRILALNDMDNLEQSIKEHGQIIDAICAHDVMRAHLTMKLHMNAVEERLSKIVDFSD